MVQVFHRHQAGQEVLLDLTGLVGQADQPGHQSGKHRIWFQPLTASRGDLTKLIGPGSPTGPLGPGWPGVPGGPKRWTLQQDTGRKSERPKKVPSAPIIPLGPVLPLMPAAPGAPFGPGGPFCPAGPEIQVLRRQMVCHRF